MTNPSPAPGFAAIIFDFDGVLADTERLHLAAFQDAFDTRGWSLDERAYVDRYMGYDDVGLIEAYVRDRALSITAAEFKRVLQDKSAAFRRRLDLGGVLYPGAAECVIRLGSAYALAVASGALRSEIVDILAAGNLLGRFSAIVGADDAVARKPAPDPYLAAAAHLRVDPARCVAIEDSRWGLESATMAGMRTIAITTTSPASALVQATRVIAHLDELTVDDIESLARHPAP